MLRREELFARLQGKVFDLLIIGGGIIGAGIARDAAMRGLTVALVEQGDFAGGTSSNTSKLIHGGLRYLEHGHVRLVREGLREQWILRTIAPEYVWAQSFLLPIYAGDRRSRWTINVGLGLYDLLACGRNIRGHRMLSARRVLAREPGLRAEGLKAAGCYADCQMDDARLCLANILQAVSFGAICVNYVRLRSFLKSNHRVCGGAVEDLRSHRTLELKARMVVNATGPWSDRVRRLSDATALRRLAPTKGIHLVVPRLAKAALFIQARADGRMLFVLPWGADATLIGTTESPVRSALETLTAEAEEVGYLLEEVKRILPGRHLGEGDIIATFAGARPLLASSQRSTSASREHRLEVDDWGMVSVLGGKFTTYRLMAQQAVDLVIRHARWSTDRCLTSQVSLLETIEPMPAEQWQTLTQQVDPALLERFISRYGAGTFQLLRLLDREPGLKSPLCPHHPILAAELVYALHAELACTITDVLVRRTRMAFSSCQGLDALSTVADLFQRYGGYTPAQIEHQRAEYHQWLMRSLAFRVRDPARPMHESGVRQGVIPHLSMDSSLA